ncbi:MAG: N-acetylmuramoyl-L-alanine amidase, partial [Pseudomonadota bacterium]
MTATTAIAREVPPPIRTSPTNQVPTCVTPERLTAFMKTRNRRLIKRFNRIAWWYQKHGNDWSVRWDYAFFQMLLETNFLSYRRPNGKWGDVNPRQNNFAGLGTTGGGVPGDSYPNVSTGVLAQIQHLVVYSGERI